jgi:hypothetical protein
MTTEGNFPLTVGLKNGASYFANFLHVYTKTLGFYINPVLCPVNQASYLTITGTIL